MMQGRFIAIDGVRTHYYEGGEQHKGAKPSILLLHSAEFGGCAETSWEYNLPVFADQYHVLAPDHLGFGLTDKLMDFNAQFAKRVWHIKRFIEAMCVDRAHVMGSSMSGGLCLTVAARATPDWPIASVVCCSGGGDAPDNDARKVLNTYDGSKEHMRRVVDVMFVDKSWARNDSYIEKKWKWSRVPGAWEATAAARFKAPFPRDASTPVERNAIDYSAIKVPTLVFAGRHDSLRNPGYTDDFVPRIPDARLHVFEHAAHMGNIECAQEFNGEVLKFLRGVDG